MITHKAVHDEENATRTCSSQAKINQQPMWEARPPEEEKSHDTRASAARCYTEESVKRGDHPYWASDATKWRQWLVRLRRNLWEGMKVQHVSGFRSVVRGP